MSEVPEDDEQGQIHLIINLLYSYASNKRKFPIQYMHIDAKRGQKLLDTYEYDLMDLIHLCDAEHLTRLAQATYLLY